MDLNKCMELFGTVKEYDSYLCGVKDDESKNLPLSDREDLRAAVKLISGCIYEIMPNKDINMINLLSSEEPDFIFELREALGEWITETERDLNSLSRCFIRLDHDFERMMHTVEKCSEEMLMKRLLSVLGTFAEESSDNFRRLITVYNDFAHLWGGFDPANGKYDHFINGIHAVKTDTDEIRWLYDTVEDYRSREVIYGLIRFWLDLDFSYKNSIKENNFNDYFDLDILKNKIDENEVFVDCGAYIGDTARSYLKNFRNFRKMYLYDVVPANLRKAKEELSGYEKIIYRNVGVGSPEQAGMKISVNDTETSTFSFGENGIIHDPDSEGAETADTKVEIVTIDNDIKEKISFLKMDIEGAETDALKGAQEHIVNDHPKLTICAYHHYEHLWEIPALIRAMDSEYRLYLRYYGATNGIMASEYVVFAV